MYVSDSYVQCIYVCLSVCLSIRVQEACSIIIKFRRHHRTRYARPQRLLVLCERRVFKISVCRLSLSRWMPRFSDFTSKVFPKCGCFSSTRETVESLRLLLVFRVYSLAENYFLFPKSVMCKVLPSSRGSVAPEMRLFLRHVIALIVTAQPTSRIWVMFGVIAEKILKVVRV